MPPSKPLDLDPENIVDQLYDIALDPNSLDPFIDAWNAAGLDASVTRKTIETIDNFDAAYHAHIKRAETFLKRGGDAAAEPDLAAILTPFRDLAAFIVDRKLTVVASNAGAQQAFGMMDNSALIDMPHAPETSTVLSTALTSLFNDWEQPDRLLRLDTSAEPGTALFQLRALSETATSRPEHALVVTTRYHWQAALGDTLEDIFQLTTAEQSVVKALVEGMDAKAIATERGTSEGTVRGQIKSILSKMNARSQSEVIRLVLSLRDVSQGATQEPPLAKVPTPVKGSDWISDQVWKPFTTLVMPDGRKMDYHEMGPANGAPILFTHMGYCAIRWNAPMINLAFEHGLRVIVPIRAGYGLSENLDPKADIMESTRNDTCVLLDHLGITKLPYACQGSDFLFSSDFAGHFPDRVTELIGMGARPPLQGDRHYAAMSKWHRFFLSTAKHAPHLLNFTTRAAIAMGKRLGPAEFFRQMNRSSPADLALLHNPETLPILIANGELAAGKNTDISKAYVMELLVSETDWSDIVVRAKGTPTWFMNGGQDPSTDIATISEYRETYPWIDIEVIPDAGQMLIFQHFENVIPKLAAAAKRAQSN